VTVVETEKSVGRKAGGRRKGGREEGLTVGGGLKRPGAYVVKRAETKKGPPKTTRQGSPPDFCQPFSTVAFPIHGGAKIERWGGSLSMPITLRILEESRLRMHQQRIAEDAIVRFMPWRAADP
jgi:hypothetical protein